MCIRSKHFYLRLPDIVSPFSTLFVWSLVTTFQFRVAPAVMEGELIFSSVCSFHCSAPSTERRKQDGDRSCDLPTVDEEAEVLPHEEKSEFRESLGVVLHHAPATHTHTSIFLSKDMDGDDWMACQTHSVVVSRRLTFRSGWGRRRCTLSSCGSLGWHTAPRGTTVKHGIRRFAAIWGGGLYFLLHRFVAKRNNSWTTLIIFCSEPQLQEVVVILEVTWWAHKSRSSQTDFYATSTPVFPVCKMRK